MTKIKNLVSTINLGFEKVIKIWGYGTKYYKLNVFENILILIAYVFHDTVVLNV